MGLRVYRVSDGFRVLRFRVTRGRGGEGFSIKKRVFGALSPN